MSFKDVMKKSFLEGFNAAEITTGSIILVLIVTSMLALYIYGIYRVTTRKTFYSKSFNISLVALAIITAAIIISIQSSVVISLGMVGALSIVRFRTAIKEPMDLVFLFWSISVGIICGAGQFEVAALTSVIITVFILVLEMLPISKPPMILVINAADRGAEEALISVVESHCKNYRIKSRNISSSGLDMILEVRLADGKEMLRELGELETVDSVSLLSHDGEITY